MSTSQRVLSRTLGETASALMRTADPHPGAQGAAAEHALTGRAERVPSTQRSFAQALAATTQPTGWDPREVWLNRVHKPRESRRIG
jgi:hypothetical protein